MKSHSMNVTAAAAAAAAAIPAVAGLWVYSSFVSNNNKNKKNKSKNTPSSSSEPSPPKALLQNNSNKVCVVGAGTIGCSFAAVFLATQKMTVVCVDPAVSREVMEQRIRECWVVLVARGLAQTREPPFHNLDTAVTLERAIQDVDFVQECVFEDVETKQEILKKLDERLSPSILIASSTSFIPWDLLFGHCQHQHRLIIGHPAIPHLGYFMEIYGVADDWIDYSQQWYAKAGFHAIVMKKTVPGHVLNSFLKVNFDHAQKLIRDGVCSPEDVNTVVRVLGRYFYASHFLLSMPAAVGGDRGVAGGRELIARIQNDAIFLTIFSFMKSKGCPDILARPISKLFGRIIAQTMPESPEELINAFKDYEDTITNGGQIPVQTALFNANKKLYELIPMEVGNDPFALKK